MWQLKEDPPLILFPPVPAAAPAPPPQFVEIASRFRPRLIVLIVPPGTKVPGEYRTLYENRTMCRGEIFYVPGALRCAMLRCATPCHAVPQCAVHAAAPGNEQGARRTWCRRRGLLLQGSPPSSLSPLGQQSLPADPCHRLAPAVAPLRSTCPPPANCPPGSKKPSWNKEYPAFRILVRQDFYHDAVYGLGADEVGAHPPACLPACLPACMPACLPACMRAWLAVGGALGKA